jgi:SSS family solute:Na+ symporter
LLQSAPSRLVSLSGVDIAIIVMYFFAVIGIGFYLKRYTKTGEDFFLAGREMTAWVAGLSFLAANLGSLELMGWAASAYQYGILATHWYWIGAIPAMLFLGIVMIPFYYISKTHSVPGYLKLRYGEPARAFSAISFGFMTVLMSGINMYSMALVLKVVLGWDIHFSIWVSSITVGVYVGLGGLLSAIFNEVLQFVLIWLGALLISIIGLIEAGGWSGMVARIHHNFPGAGLHPPVEHHGFFPAQPDGHPLGRHRLRPGLGDLVRILDHGFLVVQRVMSAKDLRAAKMAPIIGAAFKMCVPFIVILPGLLGLAVLPPEFLTGEKQAIATGGTATTKCCPSCWRATSARACSVWASPRSSRASCPAWRATSAPSPRCGPTTSTAPVPQEGHRRALRQHGPLVHHCGRADQHRHGLLRDAVQKHHGLRAGSCSASSSRRCSAP